MKKKYYDSEKDKYIIQRLSSTQIDKVWWPLISDIMLRKQYEYGLSDDIFERDLTTFINNVKEIRVVENMEKYNGLFYQTDGKIEIGNRYLGKETGFFETFYEIFAHECMHAMHFEKIGDFKQDRTFFESDFCLKEGMMEIFAECEADGLVYNVPKEPYRYIGEENTIGYSSITPYIDLISATFGVKRKELLSAAIKGRAELNMLLNKHMNLPESNGENEIFENIEETISLVHYSIYREIKTDDEIIADFRIQDIKFNNQHIYASAQEGIHNRICNIKTDDLKEFKKQFERIVLEREIIEKVITNVNFMQTSSDLDELTCYYDRFNTVRLAYIGEILENKNIQNKEELIQAIQSADDILDVEMLMGDKGISVHVGELFLEDKVVREYNKEYGYGMEWDNKSIIKYCNKHIKELRGEITTSRFQIFQQKIKNFFSGNKIKLLPESTLPENTQQNAKPWDLENWGTDKEDVGEKTRRIVEENYLAEKQNNEPKDNKNLNGHDAR